MTSYRMDQPLPAAAGLYVGGAQDDGADEYEPDYWPGEDPDEATEALMENPPPPDAYADDADYYEWFSRGVA